MDLFRLKIEHVKAEDANRPQRNGRLRRLYHWLFQVKVLPAGENYGDRRAPTFSEAWNGHSNT